MSKFSLFAVIIAWFIIASYFISIISVYDESMLVINPVGSFTVAESGGAGKRLWAMLTTFYKLITFKVEGVPILFGVVAFQIPTGVLIYMIIDVIKNIIPFT